MLSIAIFNLGLQLYNYQHQPGMADTSVTLEAGTPVVSPPKPIDGKEADPLLKSCSSSRVGDLEVEASPSTSITSSLPSLFSLSFWLYCPTRLALANFVTVIFTIVKLASLMSVCWQVTYRISLLFPAALYGSLSILFYDLCLFSSSSINFGKNGFCFGFLYPGTIPSLLCALWSLVDIPLSCVVAYFVHMGLTLCVVEPNGGVAYGWELLWSTGMLCVAFCALCAFSELISFCFTVEAIIRSRGKFCSKSNVCFSGGSCLGYCKTWHANKSGLTYTNKQPIHLLNIAFGAWHASCLALCVLLVAVTLIPLLGMLGGYGVCPSDSTSCYSHCNMDDPEMCSLPFPSSFYLTDDVSTDTGLRVAFGSKTLPKTRQQQYVSSEVFNELDGFSISAPLLCYFNDVSLEGTISIANISQYLLPGTKTLLINTKTGERISHWVELDAMDDTHPLLMLQPSQILSYNTRYVNVSGQKLNFTDTLLG